MQNRGVRAALTLVNGHGGRWVTLQVHCYIADTHVFPIPARTGITLCCMSAEGRLTCFLWEWLISFTLWSETRERFCFMSLISHPVSRWLISCFRNLHGHKGFKLLSIMTPPQLVSAMLTNQRKMTLFWCCMLEKGAGVASVCPHWGALHANSAFRDHT